MRVLVAREFSGIEETLRISKELRVNSNQMMPGTRNQAKNRPRFFLGIARALATQWGRLGAL